MASLDRSYWLAVGAAAYVGVAQLQSGGVTPLRLLTFAATPLALAWAFRVTEANVPREHGLRAAVRVAVTGALVWLQSRNAAGAPTLEIAAVLAAAVSNVAAIHALSRVPPGGGMLQPPAAARSLDAAAFAGCLWSLALVLAIARFVAPEANLRLDPLTVNYANTAAGIGGLLVLIAAAWRVRVLRQLELGVADRAAGALAWSISALAVAVPAAATNLAAPDAILPGAGILAALGTLWTVVTRDPSRVSLVLRLTVALLMLGVPVALVGALVTQQHPDHAGLVALLSCAASGVVGLAARTVAAPLGPAQSRWLNAVTLATERALVPEPNAAIVAALGALKQAFGSARAAPQLWRLEPAAVLAVDVAGYLSEQKVEIPESLCDLALGEPEQTLRVETLRALEVRKPEVRPLLAWLEARDAFSATAVLDEDGPIGFLLMPRAGRSSLLTLEEARLLRLLAVRISGLLAITSSLARSRERELNARAQAQNWKREFERLRSVLDGEGARNRGMAQNLARPLMSTCYSAAARLTLARVQQLAAHGSTLLLEVPIGSHALPWAAIAHLANHAGDGPFVFLDGAAEATNPSQRLLDPLSSPVAIAEGGTLFIQDLHLLPIESQRKLLDQLTGGAATGSGPNVGAARRDGSELPRPNVLLVASVRPPVSDLYQHGLVLRAFESLFATQRIALPTLRERADDLRALVLDALSRAAAGPGRQPLGIDRSALQALLDHDWPGNETELQDVLGRASALETQPRLSVSTLALAGFALPGAFASATAPIEVDTSVASERASSVRPPSVTPSVTPSATPPPRRRPRGPRGRRSPKN